MKINLIQEDKILSDAIGIPRFKLNEQQRNYYPYHLRHCVKYLQWISIVNFILILVILALFFTRPDNLYYLTAFDGKVTLIHPNTFEQASYITSQYKTQGDNS